MVNFLQLPGYQVSNPVDFSPISNALDSNRQLALANQKNALAQRQLGLAERADQRAGEMHTLQLGQAKRQQGVEAMRVFAGHAQSIEKMTDPAQKAAAWTRLLASHPDAANLPDIYRDPINGPRLALQEAQGFMSEKDQAQIGLIRAQTAKAQREAVEGARETYGNTPIMIENPDGTFSVGQVSNRGNYKAHTLGQGTRPARGVMQIGDEAVRRVDATAVRNVAPQIAGGERAKAEGKEMGELLTRIPAAQNAYAIMTAKDKVAFSTIDRTLPDVDNWTAGILGSAAAKIPGTTAHNLANRLNTLKAQSGFSELQAMREASPTGGALGPVSDMENKLLQQVWTSIEQSQSPEELRYNLGVLREVIAGRSERMRANIERLQRLQGGAHAGAGAPTPQGGQDMPRPSSPEEAARLPRGTRFIAPDGSIRTVP